MKAVILAGGGGTRLWQLSTPEKPKQFRRLVSDKTMLEETIERLDFLNPDDIYIAINEKHLSLTKSLCPQIPEKNIIIEPALRDTASCIGFAAAIIEKRHPDEVMAIIYADHLIKNKTQFQEKLLVAEKVAIQKNTLNIVEVTAKTPNTNYGYVKLGSLDENIDGTEVFNLDSFTEKPDKETAQKFVSSGDYLWNTGIYVWKAKTLLDDYRTHQPETYEKLTKIAQAYDTDDQDKVIADLYPTLEKISLDYAIMEKVDPSKIRIIKATDLGWSDIGSFEAIYEELAKTAHENIARGEVQISDKKPTAKDVMVINTKNGFLICKKD